MAVLKHFSPHNREAQPGSPPQTKRAAVFLDRDGTLIEEREYLSDPSEVALISGAAAALLELRQAGFALVLVTNQSAVGRGWLTETTLSEIHAELERHLAEAGVTLDAIYACPDVDAEHVEDAENAAPGSPPSADRKPGAGMLIRAAADLNLNLEESWIIGDHARDLAAGRNAGCRGKILVLTGHGEQFRDEIQPEDSICAHFADAAQCILRAHLDSPASAD